MLPAGCKTWPMKKVGPDEAEIGVGGRAISWILTFLWRRRVSVKKRASSPKGSLESFPAEAPALSALFGLVKRARGARQPAILYASSVISLRV